VLSSDESSSVLTEVSSAGEDLRTRRFEGAGQRLSVSKERGLAAVQLQSGVIELIDVENEEEEEDGPVPIEQDE
jgi:hypothetical protein